MSIEMTCKSCGQQLRVSDEHAGKQARCPACKTVMSVPAVGASTGAPSNVWHVQLEDGSKYGPVSQNELDEWVAEGRVTPLTRLRREGATDSRLAREVYPVLTGAPRSANPLGTAPPFHTQSFNNPSYPAAQFNPAPNPFTDYGPAYSPNPYATPHQPARRYTTPHRGAMILVFGLISWAVCFIFGIVAWVMGANDLKEMRAGRMDNEGYGLTQAGMIIGMIHTILIIVIFALFMLMMLVAAGA